MTSAIDPSKPVDDAPAVKANLLAAKTEIEALQGAVGAVIYAEDFGANPDGIHDDNAAAINAAIQAASAYTVAGQRRGGRVQLRRGTYLINETIRLQSLVDLAGVAMTASTVQVEPGANCRAIQTIDDNQILYGLHDLGVFGNAPGQSADDGTPAGDRGGVYLINAKAEPTAIGDYRFLGGADQWAYNLLIQEVKGNGFYVSGNSGGFFHDIIVRWAERYGHYINTNDATLYALFASRCGWSGMFFDGANCRVDNIKTWFVGVQMDTWASAKTWAQANDTTLFNRQFDDNKKAGCGFLVRGDRSRFALLDTQDTAGIGLYIQSQLNWVDGICCDQIAQVNAGGGTTRYDGGNAGAFDWVDLNPGVDMRAIHIRTNDYGYVRGHVFDLTYSGVSGTPGGANLHDVLDHLCVNEEDNMELITTGQVTIPAAHATEPVLSASPYRLNGVEFAANL